MNRLFTIDELAAATGIPTRTIRQYQTLGLLARPLRAGRVGRYGSTHRDRLDAILRLQERGYSLAGMRDLFNAWESGRELRSVVGLDGGQPEPPVDEAPTSITQAQLGTIVPALRKPANRREAVRVGLIRPGPSKTLWIVRSPSVLAMVADLLANGMSVSQALGLYEELATALHKLGRLVASELAFVEPADKRTALLQRNRPLLGRAAATLLMAAIGEALPSKDTDRVRIGAMSSGSSLIGGSGAD